MTLETRETVTVDVAAPVEDVWAHLRDPRLVRRWFGWDYDGLDDEIRQIFVDGPREHVEEADGVTTRTLTWPHHEVLTVTSRADAPGRTQVALTRRGHDALAPYDGLYDEVDEGWIAFLQQLRFALERHPGEDRVALSVLGLDAGDRHDPLLFRAGLHGVRGLPVGAHVEVTRPDGSRVGGTVVYRTAHQVGIRLHPIESLLVLMLEPAGHHPPHGRVSAVLSTFGLDEATLAEARRRWAGWWGGAPTTS
ncbi:SRPBCC family protein [Cellulomonas shaoxiangyii]|uniref:SRPBCC domain-containing protein n=1 Tax=Cellulomonas shaoxiangyii TaxID=2566013 RepID=A0A4V1CN12_9CELL|nr:SRPBCC domain-containing protein [Cellulomonas shaoxiangyii]QCB94835.1 SRPBCC domain-containing protein [Cellulomonas shaoxiangyii]TGY86566.1 SRPBCC domain-containing protein [Cellulomonas shaoxiangyii]